MNWKNAQTKILEVGTALVILLCLSVIPAFARGGGGRNSGAGGILYIILMPFIIIYGWYVNRKINQKKAQADALLDKLSKKDPAWDEKHLESVVRTTFFKIQSAWCDQNKDALKTLLATDLLTEWSLQIDDLKAKGCRNVMDGLTVDGVRIVEVQNYQDTAKDSFTVCIDAAATDYTVDRNGNIVDSNTRNRSKQAHGEKALEKFREFWTYERQGNDWKLASIDQSGNWKRSVEAPLVDE